MSVVVLQKPGSDLADGYVSFVRQNQDILREGIRDELHIQKVFDVSLRLLLMHMLTLMLTWSWRHCGAHTFVPLY